MDWSVFHCGCERDSSVRVFCFVFVRSFVVGGCCCCVCFQVLMGLWALSLEQRVNCVGGGGEQRRAECWSLLC